MLIKKTKIPVKEIILIGFLPSFLKKIVYKIRGYKIGKNVSFGIGSVIIGNKVIIGDNSSFGLISVVRANVIEIGRFEIHSYGVMLAISFLLGIYWAIHRAQKRDLDRNAVMDVSLIVVFCALIGSRALYVFTHLYEFKGNWLDTINPFPSTGGVGISGVTMLGGVVLSIIAIVVFCWIK